MATDEVRITGTARVPGWRTYDVDLKVELSLRDVFAAFALAGWRANPNSLYTTYGDAAREAYNYADAMMDIQYADAALKAKEEGK